MRRLITYFVNYPKAINILVLFFIVFGTAGTLALKSSFYPLIDAKFIEISASALGWDKRNNKGIIWEGEGLNEVGKRADNGEIIIRIDPKYFRPTEVDYLQGDSSIAQIELGWKPTISLEQMIWNLS